MRLSATARYARIIGGLGSLALMLFAGRSTPRLLLVGFVAWILSPFVLLAWAERGSDRWSDLTRTTLYVVTITIAVTSLVIYALVVVRSAGSPRGPAFVAVPPASWLVLAAALAIAAFVSRGRGAE